MTEIAFNELKYNTNQNVHYSITVGLPYGVTEFNTLLNSKDWTLKDPRRILFPSL